MDSEESQRSEPHLPAADSCIMAYPASVLSLSMISIMDFARFIV
jgi:hypothetical protein